MTNQLEKKDENLVIKDKFCETMYELIRSDDFERIFGIVLKKVGRNKEYFLGILDKIKKGTKLEKNEKDLFLELLDSKVFQEESKKIVERLKGFTLKESKKFLAEYPTEEVIEHLRGVVNNEIIDILGFKYGIEIIESKEILGENYLLLRTKGKDGKFKYCVKKEKNIKEEDFIFDDVIYPIEINGKIYYEAKLNGKLGYVEFGKEEEAKERCKFYWMADIEKKGEKYYYVAKFNDKYGYVELGKEEEVEGKFIFDDIGVIEEKKGKLYYKAKLNDKWGYEKLGEEEKAIIKYDSNKISELKSDEEGVYFNYGILRRKIYIDKN